MMLGPLQGKYTDPGSKGWRQEGLQLASLPMTPQGTSCFSSPQLWTLWDFRFWLPKGHTLAKGHSKSPPELQAITARRPEGRFGHLSSQAIGEIDLVTKKC